MTLDPELMEIMRCPNCGGSLTEEGGDDDAPPELVCGECGLCYLIKDGIPWMIVEEARRP